MEIEFGVEDGIATITINRPKQMNSLNGAAYAQLSAAWERVRDDESIRVAVITGAGTKSFCAGADITEFLGRPTPLGEFWLTQRGQLLNRGLEVWKPVIAAVNGYCLGGGMTLLLATDIRVASETATFGLSEVKRGIVAGNGGTQRILEQLPRAVAMEVILTGDPLNAQVALHWGLVNQVVPPEEVLPAALTVARKIAGNAPLAVQASKELALRARDMDRNSGMRLEQSILQVLMTSADHAEGVAAFKERRAPRFTGR